jgi:hypothetical protein
MGPADRGRRVVSPGMSERVAVSRLRTRYGDQRQRCWRSQRLRLPRPNIGVDNNNWGGANTATCGGPRQTLTVTFSGICEQMYAATGSNAVAGNLYKIDPMTAAATLVGPITNASGGGAIGLTGLDFDPISGTLYGITANGIFGGNTVSSNLVTIDPITGVATVIGSLGRANSDISFQSDGTLFGFQAGGGSGSNPAMTTINLSTGDCPARRHPSAADPEAQSRPGPHRLLHRQRHRSRRWLCSSKCQSAFRQFLPSRHHHCNSDRHRQSRQSG